MVARRPIVSVDGRRRQLPAGDTLAGLPAASMVSSIQATFDGGGSAITVGAECDVRLPYDMELARVTVLGDAAGSITVDVRVAANLASYPPYAVDSIVAATPPRLVSAVSSEDSSLTGWTTSLTAGSVVRFVVTACSGVNRAVVNVEGVKG